MNSKLRMNDVGTVVVIGPQPPSERRSSASTGKQGSRRMNPDVRNIGESQHAPQGQPVPPAPGNIPALDVPTSRFPAGTTFASLPCKTRDATDMGILTDLSLVLTHERKPLSGFTSYFAMSFALHHLISAGGRGLSDNPYAYMERAQDVYMNTVGSRVTKDVAACRVVADEALSACLPHLERFEGLPFVVLPSGFSPSHASTVAGATESRQTGSGTTTSQNRSGDSQLATADRDMASTPGPDNRAAGANCGDRKSQRSPEDNASASGVSFPTAEIGPQLEPGASSTAQSSEHPPISDQQPVNNGQESDEAGRREPGNTEMGSPGGGGGGGGGDGADKRNGNGVHKRAKTSGDVPQLEVGQLFSPNTKDLRRTCEEWFLARGHGMVCGSLGGGRQKAYYCGGAKMEGVPGKSDAKRRVGGCAAVIRFTRVTATKEWRLSRIDTAHKDCDDKGPRFSVRVAQQLSKSIITADPSIRSSAIADHLRASHGGTISERQATRVRAAVNAGKKHGREHGYRLLTSYLKELSQHSQGGYVTNIERDAGRRFKRCFVMNARGAHVVSSGPCDILSIDSGQLKGVFDGTILALTGKDADNKVVIIAFALCDAESTESVENFSFLLRNSKENAAFAAFVDSPRTTIMTGCHPGYPPVLREAVPRSEPKLCVEQMLRDAGNIGSTLRNAVSLAARAPTRSTFDASLKDIKEIMPEAYEYMMKTPLGSWTFHAGRKNRTWDQITSNFTASCSTDMIGKEARELPPFELTKHLVEMSAKKHDAASRSRRRDGEGEGEGEGESAADLTPFATSTFENERFKAANRLRSCSVGNGVYLVSADDEATNRVKMDFSPDGRLMECTCGFTSRFDMPCRHVLRVCMDENRMDVGKDFICEGYKLAAYRAANGDPRHAICPPVDMMLEADDTLPPQSVSDQAARPLKDPRPRKRVKSNGEAEPTGVHVAITTIAPSSKCSNPGPRAAPLLSSGGGTPPAGGAGARPSETPSQPEPPKPLSWK